MGSRTLFSQIVTEKTPDEVKSAIITAFRSLGGTMENLPNGVTIKQGVNGVNFAFSADFTANIILRELKDKKFDIECSINWKMNMLSWICLIVGIFIFGILWIVPLLYLFIKPDDAYQAALHRVQTFLD
jgi:hypothetical protein